MKTLKHHLVFLFFIVITQTALALGPPDDGFSQPSLRSTQLTSGGLDSRKLQSLPGSSNVVYLDFDGQTVTWNEWTIPYNSGKPIVCQPANKTSDEEYTVWKVIAEDYRPFNVNITTDSTVFLAAQAGKRQRLIITSTYNGVFNTCGSTTGVSLSGSFQYISDAPSFIFTTGVSTIEKLGEVGSHEIGHTMYLSHDGTKTPYTTYYTGYNYWAPIMGNGFSKQVTQWSKGEYTNSNNTEDDIQMLTNLLGLRADDYGNTPVQATNLKLNTDCTLKGDSGIIGTSTDVDFFKFTCGDGSLILNANPADAKPNLDIKLTLYNSSFTPILVANDSSTTGILNASINTTLTAGTYYLSVEGTGYASPLSGGYSKYGSLGLYSITGQIAASVVTKIDEDIHPKATVCFMREQNALVLDSIYEGEQVEIFNIQGQKVFSETYQGNLIKLPILTQAVYVVLVSHKMIGKFIN